MIPQRLILGKNSAFVRKNVIQASLGYSISRYSSTSAKSGMTENVSTSSLIHVDVYSDLACPWCYVGHQKLSKAIENLKEKNELGPSDVDIQWHAFLLDPSFQTTHPKGTLIDEYIASKFGAARAEAMKERLKESGASVGIRFKNWNYRANTIPGHRLVSLARKYGKSHEANLALFIKSYEEGENISEEDTLIGIAKGLELGIPDGEIEEYIKGDDGTMDVLHDAEIARNQLHVTGVPAFFIRSGNGGKPESFSGAQPVEVFEDIFRRMKHQ